MHGRLTALLAMPPERCSCLADQLKIIDANVRDASSCDEVARLLRDDPDISLVLTDLCLPDGSWFDVLSLASDLHPGASVVVCTRFADELLWTKVLEAGGFDVLVEPYEETEVGPILMAAAKTRRHYQLAVAS